MAPAAATAALTISIFFFQAEDGIRAHCVTGVQTCALPIYIPYLLRTLRQHLDRLLEFVQCPVRIRSEERRVGKECRSRRSPYPSKKNGRSAIRHRAIEQLHGSGRNGDADHHRPAAGEWMRS